jgi:hypothetical protein
LDRRVIHTEAGSDTLLPGHRIRLEVLSEEDVVENGDLILVGDDPEDFHSWSYVGPLTLMAGLPVKKIREIDGDKAATVFAREVETGSGAHDRAQEELGSELERLVAKAVEDDVRLDAAVCEGFMIAANKVNRGGDKTEQAKALVEEVGAEEALRRSLGVFR